MVVVTSDVSVAAYSLNNCSGEHRGPKFAGESVLASSYGATCLHNERGRTEACIVNGGVAGGAIMGYSGLAAGYPGCSHHGIFRVRAYIPGASSRPPFHVRGSRTL